MTTKVQPKAKNKDYISNKELYCEIVMSKAMGKLTRPAERMLVLLGRNVIKKFYYNNPDDRHDCLQNGYIQMFSNWYSFDEMKGNNAFSYYTEIFKRGAASQWNKMYKLKGDDDGSVRFVSLDGTDDDGNRFDRF
jgi:hypothetical protein